jgi:hypothetical protein
LRIVGAPIAGPATFVNPFMLHCTIFLDRHAASFIVQCNMMALPRFFPMELLQAARTVSQTSFPLIAIAKQGIE